MREHMTIPGLGRRLRLRPCVRARCRCKTCKEMRSVGNG
jgi:hypothetical protein